MEDSSVVIQSWLQKLQQGDPQAREELLARTHNRLERMTRKMLHGSFERLSNSEQTMDVVQNVYLRLLKGWDKIVSDANGQVIQTSAEYFKRTARLLREVLIDLCRSHYGRDVQRPGMIPLQPGSSDDSNAGWQHDPGNESLGPSPLSMWTEFHLAVEKLPEELRQVVDLHWYQGLTHEETGQLLDLPEPKVRRKWTEAKTILNHYLPVKGDLPATNKKGN